MEWQRQILGSEWARKLNQFLAIRHRVRTKAPFYILEPLQEWEGYVTEVSEGTFSARLVDITAGKKVEDEAADFPISDLSEDELSLLKEGAVFRWIIGYQRTKFRQKIRTSQIVFRRLPAWSKLDIRQARAEARELASGLLWD